MRVWAPWETAWPAGAALLVALVAAVLARRHLGLPRRERLPAALFVLLALAVRLVVVPALARHVFDGHEAEYWDLFRGLRAPTRGGTVLYPAMQWLWWGLGRVLPAEPWIPVVVSALVGTAWAGMLGAALGRLGGRAVGWTAAALLAFHPAQAAWSSSAYNVAVPGFFGAVCLFCAATLAGAVRPPAALAWLGGASWALAVATRLDAALVGVPALLLLLLSPRRSWAWLPGALVGGGLAGLAAWPLIYPGEVPGAGERALAFAVNVGITRYHEPFGGWPGLALLAVAAGLAARRWPWHTAILVGSTLLNHLAAATFDDYGERHALAGLPGVAWVLAAAPAGLRHRAGWLVPLAAALACLLGLGDLRGRYYGSEEAFQAVLARSPWSALPREDLEAARAGCGWVNEDPRAAATPLASHFNLLRPEEEASLRAPDGCLRWCLDLQDWRWSSRSVRDRAVRLAHLFRLGPRSVVTEPNSGYSCLVLQVGPRRRGPGAEPRRGSSEWDAGTDSPDPPLP